MVSGNANGFRFLTSETGTNDGGTPTNWVTTWVNENLFEQTVKVEVICASQ
jgi:hypothetical protein